MNARAPAALAKPPGLPGLEIPETCYMRNAAKNICIASALFTGVAVAFPATARAGLPRVLWQISGNCSSAIIVNHLHGTSQKLSAFAHAIGWNIPANPLGPAGIGAGIRQGGSAAMVFFNLPKSLQASHDPWVLILPTSNSHMVLNQLHADKPNHNVFQFALPGGAKGFVANFGSFIAITQYHRLMDIYMANRSHPLINVLPGTSRNRLQHSDAAWFVSAPVVARAAQYPIELWVNDFYRRAWQIFMRNHPKKKAQAMERRVLGLAAHDLHLRANTLLQQCVATLISVRFENGGVQLQATVATRPHGDLSRLGKSLPPLPAWALPTPVVAAKLTPAINKTSSHMVAAAESNVRAAVIAHFMRRQVIKAFWQRPVHLPAFRAFRKQCSALLSKKMAATSAAFHGQGPAMYTVLTSTKTPGVAGVESVGKIAVPRPQALAKELIKARTKMPVSLALRAALGPWFHAGWIHTVPVGPAAPAGPVSWTTLKSTLQPGPLGYIGKILHTNKPTPAQKLALRTLRLRYKAGMETYIGAGKHVVLVVKNPQSPPAAFSPFLNNIKAKPPTKSAPKKNGPVKPVNEFLPRASIAALFYPAALARRLGVPSPQKPTAKTFSASRAGGPGFASVLGNPHRITVRVFVPNQQAKLLRQLYLAWRKQWH